MRKSILTCIFIFFASDSWASLPSSMNFLKVYTTRGDFDVVYTTFKKLALFVSSSQYLHLYTVVIIGTLVIGGAAVIFANIGGRQTPISMLRLFGCVIMGVIIYKTFIQSKDDIQIYDETLNIMGTVGDVPDGLIILSGLANTLEQAFVDMIWTATGDPYEYQENPGGIMFNIIKNVFSDGADLASLAPGGPGGYINLNLHNYVDDCILKEMVRPGTLLNINDFNKTTDFLTIFSYAASPSRWTIWADDVNKAGTTASCKDSFDQINAFFSALTPASPLVRNFYKEKCGKAGLTQPAGATAAIPVDQECQNKIEAMVDKIIGSAVASSTIVVQYIIGNQLWKSLQDGDFQDTADYQAGTSMMGMAEMANDWIPILRGMVFAIFVGIIPFAALLLVTPKYGTAFGFISGIFIFLVSWGVCDAMIHSYAMDKSIAIMKGITNGQLGIKSILMFHDRSAKALSVFAAARWLAMSIAGILSTLVGGFSGTAISGFVSQLSEPKQIGAQTASTFGNPDQKASKMAALEGAIPTQTMSNMHGFNGMMEAAMYRNSSQVETDRMAVKEFGGGDPLKAAGSAAFANTVNMAERMTGAGVSGIAGAENNARIENTERLSQNAGKTVSDAELIGSTRAEIQKRTAGSDQVVFGNTSKDDFIEASAYSELSSIKGNQRIIEDPHIGNGSVITAADRSADNILKSKLENQGYTDSITPEQAHRMGIVAGKEKSGYTEAVGNNAHFIGNMTGKLKGLDAGANHNFFGEYGEPAYQKSKEFGMEQSYGSSLVNDYVGQALSGDKIDPVLQQEISRMNSTPEGRMILQTGLAHSGRLSNISATESEAINRLAGRPLTKEGDSVSNYLGFDENGKLAITSGQAGQSWDINNTSTDRNGSRTETGDLSTHYNDAQNYVVGSSLNQDAVFNRLVQEATASNIENGISDPKEARELAIESVTKTLGYRDMGASLNRVFSKDGAAAVAIKAYDIGKEGLQEALEKIKQEKSNSEK